MQSWKAKSRGTQMLKISLRVYEKISCVLIDERSQSVFAATDLSTLNQVDLRSQKKLKKSASLKIGIISCMSSFHNLLIVGGYSYRFILINIAKRIVLTVSPVITPMRMIMSFQVAKITRKKKPIVALVVSGRKSLIYCL